jgi:phosphatidylethanolamine/phosphatidyl-N-methylethanolamine N-methyltransferase
MDNTEQVRRRFDQFSRSYDRFLAPMERMFLAPARRRLFALVNASNYDRIIEAGVGTGNNLSYYNGQTITGIDISSQMIGAARKKSTDLPNNIYLQVADIQNLPFADDTFDAAVATFVFCSVPDPKKGLSEMRRVVKPGGRIYLLEHCRPTGSRIMGAIFDLLNPLALLFIGDHINRRTADILPQAGLEIESRDERGGGVLQMIESAPIGKIVKPTTVAGI